VQTELAQAGLRFEFGNGTLLVLAPSLTGREASDSNDASIVVAGSFDGIALLALGDLGEAGQLRLISKQIGVIKWLSRQNLVLKVSHHGSADQSDQLTRMVNPDIALISAGLGNSYGHPTDKTLSLLSMAGAKVLRTDVLGPIALSYQDGFRISAGGKL
jgi:competence protein ComEC